MTAVAIGLVGLLLAGFPAPAGPGSAPRQPAACDDAQRFAARADAQLMRVGRVGPGPADRDSKHTTGTGVGATQAALQVGGPHATPQVSGAEAAAENGSFAAASRLRDARSARAIGPAAPARPANPAEPGDGVAWQQAPSAVTGPRVRTFAAATAGPFGLGAGRLTSHATWATTAPCGAAGRALAEIDRVEVAGGLVTVPGAGSSLSTTALERRGEAAGTVAAASLAVGDIDVLGGAVTIEVLAAPSLRASMSVRDGGEIRYVPAVVRVGGAGFAGRRLDTAGDRVTAVARGRMVEISLGDLRQTSSGHANTARAVALKIIISRYGHSAPHRTTVVLDLDVGLLEVAATSPEPSSGGVPQPVGLASTGPRIDVLGLAGVVLVVAGAAALIFGIRGRLGR